MKPILLVGCSIITTVILIAAVAFASKKDEMPEKHVEVVLRDLGHQLLLSANDSSSRVLPVKKLSEHTYRISFQNDFRFISDTLINLVQRKFEKAGLAENLVVSLQQCDQNEAVFAFEVNGPAGDLTPCRGRTLDVGCYVIEVEFLEGSRFNPVWLALLLIPLLFAGLYQKKKFRKKEEKEPVPDHDDHLQLGIFRLYPDSNVLRSEESDIVLSEKEAKALKIFAENINQTVEREKLMKELWEDEGVVVISRNVDVLVSKLRKKLSDDSSIRFITVPGRGYKCIVG